MAPTLFRKRVIGKFAMFEFEESNGIFTDPTFSKMIRDFLTKNFYERPSYRVCFNLQKVNKMNAMGLRMLIRANTLQLAVNGPPLPVIITPASEKKSNIDLLLKISQLDTVFKVYYSEKEFIQEHINTN